MSSVYFHHPQKIAHLNARILSKEHILTNTSVSHLHSQTPTSVKASNPYFCRGYQTIAIVGGTQGRTNQSHKPASIHHHPPFFPSPIRPGISHALAPPWPLLTSLYWAVTCCKNCGNCVAHLAFRPLVATERIRLEEANVIFHTIGVFPKIGGFPPKSSILMRFFIINHPFWGTPIFGNTHIIMDLFNLRKFKCTSFVFKASGICVLS